jgi:Esterase/lipase
MRLNLLVLSILLNVGLWGQNNPNQIINLYKGIVPGSENWNWEEVEIKRTTSTSVYNVTKPSLTVFEPAKDKATGVGVVICPGGGFYALAIDNEGYKVAKWLNKKGITAFVLKYRLMNKDSITSVRTDSSRKQYADLAISDGITAMNYVRENASNWNLKHIGIMGFSAGGTVTTGVAFGYNHDARPDFVAPIYPFTAYFANATVPADAPPMFITVASDDNLKFNKQSIELYTKWYEAKKSVEMHIYSQGGHGFGMTQKNIPTDTWIERFYEWLMNLKLD